MKTSIEIEFSEDYLDEIATENLSALLYKAIFDIKDYADVQKVSVDGKEFWNKEKDSST